MWLNFRNVSLSLCVAGAIALAFAGGRFFRPKPADAKASVSPPPVALPTPQTAPSTQAAAGQAPAATEESAAPAVPTEDDCFDNDIMALESHSTAKDRIDQALKAATTFADNDFFVKAGGRNFEYLLISADPTHAGELSEFAQGMRNNESVMLNLCMKGFKGVQFMTRDASMNQILVAKFPTSLRTSLRYLQRTQGATPTE